MYEFTQRGAPIAFSGSNLLETSELELLPSILEHYASFNQVEVTENFTLAGLRLRFGVS